MTQNFKFINSQQINDENLGSLVQSMIGLQWIYPKRLEDVNGLF